MKSFRRVVRSIGQALWHGLRSLPYTLAGYVITPFLYKYRAEPYAALVAAKPRLSAWINPEDWTGGWREFPAEYGCIPPDLQEDFKGAWGFYRYHALRNAAGGLKAADWHNLPLTGPIYAVESEAGIKSYEDWWLWKYRKPEPGKSYWYVAWQGKHAGFKYIRYFSLRGTLYFYECKLGWRIVPQDSGGRIEGSHRWEHGATPTLQPGHFGRAGRDWD